VTLAPMGGVPHLAALNVSRLGSSTDAVELALYRDDGSGALDAADAFLSNVSMVGNVASLPMNELVAAPEVLWVEARWANLPPTRTRTYPVPIDTDLDTVPDAVENQLGPNLTRDFNNDNITDDRTGGDVDADGIVDYPAGPDCWLNTTIPSWYPPPYAGRVVTRYICPIGLPL